MRIQESILKQNPDFRKKFERTVDEVIRIQESILVAKTGICMKYQMNREDLERTMRETVRIQESILKSIPDFRKELEQAVEEVAPTLFFKS